MSFELVMIDADGTLLDFNRAERQALVASLKKHGVEADGRILARYHEINESLWKKLEQRLVTREELLATRFTELFREFGIALDGVGFNRFYLNELGSGGFLMEGARELLDRLAGRCELVIVTNGVSETQHRRLNGAGIHELFSAIVVSDDAGYQKPDPRFFDFAFTKCVCKDRSKALILGDSLSADIAGGKNYGIKTCWFNPKRLPLPKGAGVDYMVYALPDAANVVEGGPITI